MKYSDKEMLQRRLPRYKKAIMMGIMFFVMALICLVTGLLLHSRVHAYDEAIASVENMIAMAQNDRIVVDVFTNIDDIVYDSDRCGEDDKMVYNYFKNVLSYEDYGIYNKAVDALCKDVKSATMKTLFPKIDYVKEQVYSEDGYVGKSESRFSSSVDSFKTYVVSIHDDSYEYLAVANVTRKRPSRVIPTQDDTIPCVIVLHYIVDADGEIDYSSVNGMIRTD